MTYRLDDLEVPAGAPFQNDSLERQPLVEFLSKLIKNLNGPFVMALDSPWGSGKTTLVRMLMEHLKGGGFQCIYFNAWKVDYVTDPLIALVSSIDRMDLGTGETNNNYKEHLKSVKKVTTLLAKRGLAAGAKALTCGILDFKKEWEAAASEIAAGTVEDIVDAFNQECDLLKKFREALTSAVKQLPAADKKRPLIFFIDELDRCRPTFAIDLLERVKHLFDIPNIVFMLSIDKQQLEASTKAVYGASINATEYLRRFIDLEYSIPAVNSKHYTKNLLIRFELDTIFSNNPMNAYDRNHFIEFFTQLSHAMDLSLRARERCITRLRIVMDQLPDNSYLDPMLIALLIVLRSNHPQLFHRFVRDGALAEKELKEYLVPLPGGGELYSEFQKRISRGSRITDLIDGKEELARVVDKIDLVTRVQE